MKPVRQIRIFDPQGAVVWMDQSRKSARAAMAQQMGCKWNDLWQRGYRVSSKTAPKFDHWSIVERWT